LKKNKESWVDRKKTTKSVYLEGKDNLSQLLGNSESNNTESEFTVRRSLMPSQQIRFGDIRVDFRPINEVIQERSSENTPMPLIRDSVITKGDTFDSRA
jgi:hypothetical protein